MSKKKASASEQAAVVKYMRQQNRPFSVQNLVDALQSESIKKSGCERALNALVEQDEVVRKEYGKSKLYLINQKKIELPEDEQTQAEVAEVGELKKKIEAINSQLASLRSQQSALESTLSLEEARARVEKLGSEVEEKEGRLQELGDPDELPTEEDKTKVETDYFRARTAWKKRKRIVKNIIDTVSEGMQKKPKELFEMVGLEADEEAGVELASFPEIEDPLKVQKRASKRRRVS